MSKKPENQPELDEEEFETPELIELIDEQGKIINFKLLDVTEYKGVKYTLLLAAESNEEIAEDEVVIFRLNEKDETLEPVESEELLQEIFDFYQQEVDGEELISDEEN
ncbi:MAG: DUF1292 domain-containing protein [Clostridia bacterium]|nr:DUF1292 domain-containing protein [Clostridia bacterium]